MKEQRPRGETHLVRVASGKGRPPCELRFLMWNQAVVPASLGAGEDSVRGCRWVPITQERAQCPACSVYSGPSPGTAPAALLSPHAHPVLPFPSPSAISARGGREKVLPKSSLSRAEAARPGSCLPEPKPQALQRNLANPDGTACFFPHRRRRRQKSVRSQAPLSSQKAFCSS